MPIKLETMTIRTIATFENVTNVHAVDCIIADDYMCFLVDPEKVGLAIGKNGSTIKQLRKMFNKQIKVFGYYRDPESLVKGVIPEVIEIEQNSGALVATLPSGEKLSIIEKNNKNIKILKEILKRHFSIKTLKLR
ncbi:MAG: NusA-like transcription termination signal-binding factor [Candidatus Aenigmatarchaeota archaeon]